MESTQILKLTSSRSRRPVRPPAGSVTDDDRQQTTASKTILAQW